MLKTSYKILNLFAEQPWKRFTFNEIKLLSKKKSDSYVYGVLKDLAGKKILHTETAGKTIVYSVEKTQNAIVYLAWASEYHAWSQKHLPCKTVEKIMAKIPTSFFTFIITGSYAKNRQTPTSDIDIAILCDNKFDPQKIYAELRQECELSTPEAHLYVFKEKEFYEMLTNKKASYGKEIAKNNLLLYGAASYYKTIMRAIINGFNG